MPSTLENNRTQFRSKTSSEFNEYSKPLSPLLVM